jgi:hypothetical protein
MQVDPRQSRAAPPFLRAVIATSRFLMESLSGSIHRAAYPQMGAVQRT